MKAFRNDRCSVSFTIRVYYFFNSKRQVMKTRKFKLHSLIILTVVVSLLIVVVSACHSATSSNNAADSSAATLSSSRVHGRDSVITADEQKKLTPDMVLQDLKEGNKHYANSSLTPNDYVGMLHHATDGQFPEAFVLACIDSRVPVEEIFNKAIGDLFVGRVAGNFVDQDILGSMEYGCKVSGAKLIVVLGHESCGAIKATIEDERLGNITAMLANIKPALLKSKDFAGEQTAHNHAFVDYVVKNNVKNTIQTILVKSPVLKEMADKGEIKIVGAYYSLENGEVLFL